MKCSRLALLLPFLLAACTQPAQAPPTESASVPEASSAALRAQATGYWVSGTYSNAYGARYYRLWVPGGYDGATARPMMVMLHGCTQDGYDFAAGTRMNTLADARNFLVLYPEQGTAYNGYDCWNWFYDVNQHRGSGEPSLIAGMISLVKSNYRVDSARVGVAGLSAGAAMANIMGCTYPDHIRKVAAFAGVMYQGATTASGATSTQSSGSPYDPNGRGNACHSEMGTRKHVMPTLLFHGSSDSTVSVTNTHQTGAQWAQTNDLAYDGLDDADIDNTADATVSGTACRAYTRYDYKNSATGGIVSQKYIIGGLGHAWSGGSTAGSYSDPCGPDASTLVVNFFGF